MDLFENSRHLGLILFVTFAVVVVLGIVISVKVGRRRDVERNAALALLAAEMGLQFTPMDYTLVNGPHGFSYYPRGSSQTATSVMWGMIEGWSVVLFDYHVILGTPRAGNRVRLTVAAFDLASRPLPAFEAEGGRQSGFLRMIDKTLAEKVVDFPDDPDFSKYFCLTSDDAPAVRGILGPEVRSVLKQHPDWMIKSNGRRLLMYRGRRHPEPAEFRAFVTEALEMAVALTGARV